MSGINEIKRKAKLSIDEMYDKPTVGIIENQETEKPENQQPGKPEIHSNENSSPMQIQEEISLENHKNVRFSTEQSEKNEINPMHQTIQQATIFPKNLQTTQKIPTYKMTFNLSEKAYKTFNDLYAKRMLMGRKTEKSEMICEAIQWLLEVDQFRECTTENNNQETGELIKKLAKIFQIHLS